jgi:AcrR family transcriptional regulator
MMARPKPVAAVRGRPRDHGADARILAAARRLLAESGFDNMSFEAVAQRAGVTRPTIYRRWPTKAHLANEIANGGGGSFPDVMEAEGIAAEIRLFLQTLIERYSRPEMAAAHAGLIVTYQRSPELREELHTPLELRARADLARIIDQGKRLGTVKASVDADALFDLAVGAVVFRATISSLPVSDALLDQLCGILLTGVQAPRQADPLGT